MFYRNERVRYFNPTLGPDSSTVWLARQGKCAIVLKDTDDSQFNPWIYVRFEDETSNSHVNSENLKIVESLHQKPFVMINKQDLAIVLQYVAELNRIKYINVPSTVVKSHLSLAHAADISVR